MNLKQEGIERGIVIKTDLSRKLTIDGHTDIYPVYKVKLDCLYFNDKNDRIVTWISKYKAEHNIDNLDITNKKLYNDVIHGFIHQSNPDAIKKTQANIELVDQREPGVILTDGRIIDGNRRVTCLRNLAKENLRFNYFETVILDVDLKNNEKQIKMLELTIQHGEESKVDYNPIDRLVGVYNDIVEKKLLTVKEYAYSTNKSEVDINKQVELSKLLVEFLEFINAPKQFHIARDLDLNGPLVELQSILKKITDEDQKEELKNIVFINFLMQPESDMTRFIRKIKTIASSNYIDEYLEEQMDIAEEVLDKLEEIPQDKPINNNIINNHFRNDEKIKEALKRSLDKAETKAKSKASRNKPIQTLDKVADFLDTIDTNIFMKYNDEEKSEIITKVEIIKNVLDKIKEDANV